VAEVTFLMSTWNAGPHIRPAIESVLAQTEHDWQMVVVDDGSSDGTPDVVRGYGDPRIRLVEMPQNAGQTAALNHGLGLIETKWVARLDQDDVAAPTRVELQLAWLHEHPRAVAVGSWIRWIDEQGNSFGEERFPAEPHAAIRQLYTDLEHNPFAHSAMTYDHQTVLELGSYRRDIAYAQDTALWMDLATRGEVGNVPEFLTSIRRHPGQASGTDKVLVQQFQEVLLATADAPERLGLDPADARAWRRSRIAAQAQLALLALRDGEREQARRHARTVVAGCRTEPAALLNVAAVLGRTARYRAGRLASRG
jgi:glycosyltransferase involved in cell wall biosynthesis